MELVCKKVLKIGNSMTIKCKITDDKIDTIINGLVNGTLNVEYFSLRQFKT